MTSTSPTETRLTARRNAVPLLLSSFPVPPSHIPPTPMSSALHTPLPSPNPPLSRPPSTPLPPVPGPSPITEHETLRFISAARSKRASKLSLASASGSTYSCRDSVTTLASLSCHTTPLSPILSPIMTYQDHPSRPLRSFPSNSSLSIPTTRIALEKSPMFEPRICEEDSDTADLTHISIPDLSPMPSSTCSSIGFSDTDEEVLDLGLGASLSRRPRRTHRGTGNKDSISSMELQDLPALQEGETDFSSVPPIESTRNSLTKTYPHLRPDALTLSLFPRPPTAILNKDLPPLPLDDDNPATPTSADSSQHTPTTTTSSAAPQRPGAESPDISTIIAATPKPQRRSKSRSRPNSTRRSGRHSGRDIVVPVPSLDRVWAGERRRRSYDDDDEEEDYGQVLDGTGTFMDWRMLDAAVETKLERELEGFGSDDDGMSDGSDSSIDVNTPLPNLMLRDGMLSPHSKLLAASRAATPYDRHLSIISNVSIMTKSGIYKDERNTTQRRVRHRDGKLLRGGIGLTTGLGWSDSEDEDAPSLLTRQVSSMVLSRRTSSSSLSAAAQQARPSALVRSVSDTLTSASASLALHQARMKEARPSLPPTSWASGSASGVSSTRTSTSSLLSHPGKRTSETTVGHSLDDIKEQEAERERDEFGAMTPSSASSSSLPMPLTPVSDVDMWMHARDKQPFSAARRAQSRPNMKSAPFAIPRERTTSSSSHGSYKALRSTANPAAPSKASAGPRPLRLTQSSVVLDRQAQAAGAGGSGIRAPTVSRSTSASSNVPKTPRARTASGSRIAAPASAVPHLPSRLPSRLATPSAVAHPHASPVTPTRPGSGVAGAAARSRTGTGMTYRTSASHPRPSMMRAPSTTMLRGASAGTRI